MWQRGTFFKHRDEHVGGHGNPDLRLHRVLAVVEEALDSQMLLDPFEEQLHFQRRLGRLSAQGAAVRRGFCAPLGPRCATDRSCARAGCPKM